MDPTSSLVDVLLSQDHPIALRLLALVGLTFLGTLALRRCPHCGRHSGISLNSRYPEPSAKTTPDLQSEDLSRPTMNAERSTLTVSSLEEPAITFRDSLEGHLHSISFRSTDQGTWQVRRITTKSGISRELILSTLYTHSTSISWPLKATLLTGVVPGALCVMYLSDRLCITGIVKSQRTSRRIEAFA